MRKGFTTGSCAAAAAKAAAMMLLGGRKVTDIEIETPAGVMYRPLIEETQTGDDYVRCAVRKQAGDDPDATDGILVFAKVMLKETGGLDAEVVIEGGEGVGRVTKPGLDQPVGNAAINSVPRWMIEQEVRQVMDLYDQSGIMEVTISVPGGRELAAKTFNPRLGIEGGISIIGTTGIVEPMSTKALLDTIYVELRQKRILGCEAAVITPGNYGRAFMREKYGYDLENAVKCSNFIGDTVDMASSLGYTKLLLCGHVGKLIKVSGGIMNTHSREADCRMELMAAAAIHGGVRAAAAREILECVTSEEAVGILIKEGIDKPCFRYITDRIRRCLNARSKEKIDAQCIMYSNRYGLLGLTERAEEYLGVFKERNTV